MYVVEIAAVYGLDGAGIEYQWGRDFPYPFKVVRGPPTPLYNGYRISFPRVKRPGRGVNHPPPSIFANFSEGNDVFYKLRTALSLTRR